VLGWGRYETFEFGCTVAFHDPSVAVRSYVVVMLIFVLGIPLGTKTIPRYNSGVKIISTWV
jgi:hypothetical protein